MTSRKRSLLDDYVDNLESQAADTSSGAFPPSPVISESSSSDAETPKRNQLSRFIDPFGVTPVPAQRRRRMIDPNQVESIDDDNDDSRPPEQRTEIDTPTSEMERRPFSEIHRNVISQRTSRTEDLLDDSPPRTPLSQIDPDRWNVRLERLVSNMPESSSSGEQFSLTTPQARHIVTTFWLAQVALMPTTTFFLHLTGEPQYPNNQQGEIYQETYARVAVTIDPYALVANRFDPAKSEKFGLKARFIVGDNNSLRGLRANIARFPVPFVRPSATMIPWQSYNPAVQSEVIVGTSNNTRNNVAFTNAPNVALNGDSFYIKTTREVGLFSQVGTSPNDDETDEVQSSRLHFYDTKFADKFRKISSNLYGLSRNTYQPTARIVSIDIDNAPPLSKRRFDNGIVQVLEHITTPDRLDRALHAIIVDREQLI